MFKPFLAGIGLAVSWFSVSPGQSLYHEKYRPQFHFTARQWTYSKLNPGQTEEGWQNDMNGLVYVAGEYHYFAQRWAHAWIHAVSKDLVHWEELKPAFWGDDEFGPTQSGTVVIDSNNTSGLRTGANPLMVAFWASWDNKYQCISYSNDLGRTWTKYAGNPVLVHSERDPQVFWHAPTKKWIMVLYDGPGYAFFTSDNLIAWRFQSKNPDFYECPDMFQLAVDGDKGHMEWVLMNGDGSYQLGGFNGTAFSPETAKRRLDWGGSFYATQSWHNIPEADGRRIQAVWMRTDGGKIYPDMPFNQQTSFPAVMTLRNYADSLRIFRNPIREIEMLHQTGKKFAGQSLHAGSSLGLDAAADAYHILATVTLADNSEGAFRIHGITVRIANDGMAVDGDWGGFAKRLNHVNLELLVDRTSIEAFGNDGEVSITDCIKATDAAMSIKCVKGGITVDTLTQYPLASIWPASARQGFRTNLAGDWTSVGASSWKDTATGKLGGGDGDAFSLSPQSGSDFTYEGDVELFTAAGASLVFRANAGATEGYCVNVDIAGLIKLWAPGRGELLRFLTPIQAKQPYHLKVAAAGANIKVYYNYRIKPVIDFTDATPILSGRFGVNAYSGLSQFQDLILNAPVTTGLRNGPPQSLSTNPAATLSAGTAPPYQGVNLAGRAVKKTRNTPLIHAASRQRHP